MICRNGTQGSGSLVPALMSQCLNLPSVQCSGTQQNLGKAVSELVPGLQRAGFRVARAQFKPGMGTSALWNLAGWRILELGSGSKAVIMLVKSRLGTQGVEFRSETVALAIKIQHLNLELNGCF